MSDFGNKAELMTTKFNENPTHIRFEYVESKEYVACHPNGIMLVAEPRGETTILFYHEQKERLDCEVVKLTADNKPGKVIVQHGLNPHLENEMIIIREMLAEITLPPHRLDELIEGLVQHRNMQLARKK